MPTQVHFFLPPPEAANSFREAHPYGPSEGGFNTDLAIEIDPAHLAPALSVIPGMARLIPNPLADTTCTLVLKPMLRVWRDLAVVLGRSPVYFVYRNLELASVRSSFEPRIGAAGNQRLSQEEPLEVRVNRFLSGGYAVLVDGGVELGLPSSNGDVGGWSRLGFEIIFMPSGLDPWEGWSRIQQLINPASTTRRLDPMAFYAAVVSGDVSYALAQEHAGHVLVTLATGRTLLELRDEYDQPFVGTAEVIDSSTGTGIGQRHDFTEGNRGTVELARTPPGAAPPSATYTILLANHVFTRLPSGTNATVDPESVLTSPAHWVLQTIFMADVDDPSNWFVENAFPLPRYTEANKVTYLIDGLNTFREMVAALRTVSVPEHYLRLAAWWLTDSFAMIPGDSNSTFARVTQDMDAAGAEIHALLWQHFAFRPQNAAEVNHINTLPHGHGHAILDSNTLPVGCHHQKLMIINGHGGAVAFCGGVDINPDRLDSPRHGAEGAFHDIHAKVEGAAVRDLNTTFVQRWNNHPDVGPRKAHSEIDDTAPPFASSPGSQYVQVTRTYPERMDYLFAQGGDLGTLNAVRRAIQRARRFIYIEDQYLTPYPGPYPFDVLRDTVGVLTDLLAALNRVEYVIVVVPNHCDQPENRYRRHRFIRPLRDTAPNKVHVFFLGRTGPRPGPGEVAPFNSACDFCSNGRLQPDEIYVHSKTWIIDDVYAKIGSANCSRRGFTHESEVDIHIIDGALLNGGREFARRYRMDLWAEHLNMVSPAGRARLEDPTFALQFWLHPPLGSHIRPYDENAEHDCDLARNIGCSELGWEEADPDGRRGWR